MGFILLPLAWYALKIITMILIIVYIIKKLGGSPSKTIGKCIIAMICLYALINMYLDSLL